MQLWNSIYKLSSSETAFVASGDALARLAESNRTDLTVMFHPAWRVGIVHAARLKKLTNELQRRKNIRVIVCGNEPKDICRLRIFGVECCHFNQNMHTCEHDYYPLDNLEKLYEAIYFAQGQKFKRLWLASEIETLYVLTYHCRKGPDGHDLHSVEPSIAHCDFNRGYIEKKEDIRQLLSSSHVGLALSKREGAMWASAEYLLSGLPVVTTHNRGGRDHYFDKRFVKWVRDNPVAVNAAVQEFVRNPIAPITIRNAVLDHMIRDRHSFLNRVNQELQKQGLPETTYKSIWGGEQGIEKNRIQILER